jgi:hypothetical protein
MTEAEWLACSAPAAMLDALRGPMSPNVKRLGAPWAHEVSDRKLRLWVCACCRFCWSQLADERSRKAVEVAEAFADGEATDWEWGAAQSGAATAHLEATRGTVAEEDLAAAALRCVTDGCLHSDRLISPEVLPPAAQAALLREIFGNPFRPVAPDPAWLTPDVLALARAAYSESRQVACLTCRGTKEVPSAAHPGTVRCPACAGSARVADGLLDPDRLAVLADALEEAGCDCEPLLRHLRGWEPVRDGEATPGGPNQGYRELPGPHCRGCWALDLLLGKD